MIFFFHFILVLFPASCTEEVWRIYVHENIFIVKFLYKLYRRSAFYLCVSQAFCRLKYPARKPFPVKHCVRFFSSLYIIFPSVFIFVCPISIKSAQGTPAIYLKCPGRNAPFLLCRPVSLPARVIVPCQDPAFL